MAGWPLSTVSEVLGHRKQSTTSDTYSNVLTEEPDWLLDQFKEQIRDGSVMAHAVRRSPGYGSRGTGLIHGRGAPVMAATAPISV